MTVICQPMKNDAHVLMQENKEMPPAFWTELSGTKYGH